MMRFSRGFLIFSFGLFTIASQSLLFREFITTFEGNDIGVGIFFGSWLLWVALGALLVYKWPSLGARLSRHTDLLLLAYIPAFLVQLMLIVRGRELAGVESYELFTVNMMLLMSVVVNAPLSCITGIIFPTACRWVAGSRQEGNFPVSRVYILEAAGSFIGGLAVTVLVALGIGLGRIFFLLALIVAISVFLVQFTKAGRWVTILLPLCVLGCIFGGIDKQLNGYIRQVRWAQLFDESKLSGSLQTAQAEYLYGVYQGQWIALRQGSVCEAPGDKSSAGRAAAICLSQKPDAKKVLVIGAGLTLCDRLLQLEQIEQVTWAHSDSEYVQRINSILPTEFIINDKRFVRLKGDVRAHLANTTQDYDIVIVTLPEATSSVFNRYYTVEFYQQVKNRLGTGGVLAVRIPGGENIMGSELVNLGASTKLTLEQIFSRLVLTPGEETWFIASDSDRLTDKPGVLADRFGGIKNSAEIFPAAGLLSVYLPDRAEKAFADYASADLPDRLLINRDTRPLANLYSLLLAAKQSGAPVTKFVKGLGLCGVWVFLVPIVIFTVLRIVYIVRTPKGPAQSGFDSLFLVFSAGGVGIGVMVILMYLYQTRLGSLYLYIGIISSLFMLGLTIGGFIVRYLLVKRDSSPQVILFVTILLHSALLILIAQQPIGKWSHELFGAAFVLSGLCAGAYFPLAAGQMAGAGFDIAARSSQLEMSDHLGAAVGGFIISLAVVPVLGSRVSLFLLAAVMAANGVIRVVGTYRQPTVRRVDTLRLSLRRAGYALFCICVTVIICSNIMAAAMQSLQPSLPDYAAAALAGQNHIEAEERNENIKYFKVYNEADKITGYIFSSAELANEVRGFGGKINLAIHVDMTGKLLGFNIISSNETPGYLGMLDEWLKTIKNYNLFEEGVSPDVHTVTGATVSSKAIVSALQISGGRFANEILGRDKIAGKDEFEPFKRFIPDTQGAYLIGAVILALIATYHAKYWSRVVVLMLNLIVGGIILNAQYGSEQIVGLLRMSLPEAGLGGTFLLAVGLPLLVLVFGNLYCGKPADKSHDNRFLEFFRQFTNCLSDKINLLFAKTGVFARG